MDNKDLFDAIDKAAEEFVPDLLDSIEGERPIVLHADNKPRSVKRIVFGAAACAAAAVVLGAAVTVGVKNYSQRGSLISVSSGSSAGNIERNFAPAEEILRIRDVGFYSEGMSDDSRKILEEHFKDPLPKEKLEKLQVVSWIKPPVVFYYNDTPLDRRMLSAEADGWLLRYCLMSEEDRAGETVPEEVKYLTGSGIVRYGDVGFLEDKYTEQELEHFKAYCASPLLYSCFPPEPDVFYYNDIPYHLDQIGDYDTQNWLKWFCWLDEESQAQLGGYVPRKLSNPVTFISYCEEPHINYRGKVINFNSISEDTQSFLRWYNLLPAELKGKVGYEPWELSPESLKKYPDANLPVELIGADGVPLTYKDLSTDRTTIYKLEHAAKGEDEIPGYTEITITEIDQWYEICCNGFVYLAEPGSDEFKRYNIGDEINGLKITQASTTFRRFEGVSDPALYYAGGDVSFEGTAKVDILAVKRDGEIGYRCAVSGLPVIDIDEQARAEGRIVPKPHFAEEFADDPNALLDPESSCTGYILRLENLGQYPKGGELENLGQIQKDVEIENINMAWQYDHENTKRYFVITNLPEKD